MNPWFTYTDEQRNRIRTVVRDELGKDADQIECQVTRYDRTVTLSLLDRIEAAASAHIPRSAFESQTPGHKERIKKLTDLRDTAKALRNGIIDALSPSFTLGDNDRVKFFPPASFRPIPRDACDKVERATATLVSVIEASIAAQRPQPTANTRKAGRDRFWNEALAIWIDIGGAETGNAAAEFLIAVSGPVFERVRAMGGHKTTASMPHSREAVVEWLRLRAKARQAATP